MTSMAFRRSICPSTRVQSGTVVDSDATTVGDGHLQKEQADSIGDASCDQPVQSLSPGTGQIVARFLLNR